MGIPHIVMITGDGEKTAANVAARLGITEFYSQVLPDGKSAIVSRLEKEGRRVLMIGDGINDTPALSGCFGSASRCPTAPILQRKSPPLFY